GAAEVNLYSRDIANILLAKKLQIPIVIVGDIERGGIFVQLIGTYDLLPEDVRINVCGFIVNKFRGDSELFREGVRIIEEKTGVDVLGVIPYTDTELPSEDSLSLYDKRSRDFPVKIAVMKIFGLSNFNDFELLERYACLDYVTPGTSLKDYDCIIIPGTKNTVEALLELKSRGFADEIADARRRKIPIIGICGGYQMLCRKIHDEGIESGSKADYEGFGLFDAVTTFAEYKKTTVQITRKVNPVGEILSGADTVSGYEIHMGQTDTGSEEKALEGEGCVSADGLVIGTYMHGLFSNANISQSLLKYLYSQKGLTFAGIKEEDIGYDKALNELAQHFEANTDFEKILAHFDTTRIRTD
ncbi:MAG: cobyric acid synthase, partial [Methanomicrobium sp.]|nr:cobyric acid synthase [Methanomicrobium sp.]